MSFFNSLQQYVTSSVANLSLSPKRFSLSKESSSEIPSVGSEEGNGNGSRSGSTGSVNAPPLGFPKVVPPPGTSTPPRRRTLEGPKRTGSFKQASQHRRPLFFCKRRLSWPEVDQQATSGVQETDGQFFEKYTSLIWKLENRRLMAIQDVAEEEKPIPDELVLGVIPPSPRRISSKELEQLYIEVLYTITNKVGASSGPYSYYKEELYQYAQKAFGITNEQHRRYMAIASEEKPPIIVLNVVVIEAENLEAKDANGFSDPYCLLGITNHSILSSSSLDASPLETDSNTVLSPLAVTISILGDRIPCPSLGFSDPFCMLGIQPAYPSPQSSPCSPAGPSRSATNCRALSEGGLDPMDNKYEHHDKLRKHHSFRLSFKRKDRREHRDSISAVPAKFIRATSVRPHTLNPRWNEKFRFDIDDVSSDILHLDIWDHDDESSVFDAVSKLNEVRGVKGLGRFFKQIAQSARSGSQDDFLGCVNIPLQDLPSTGREGWYKLEARTQRSNIQGRIRLKLWLSTREDRGTSEEDNWSDLKQQERLYTVFINYEMSKCHNGELWSGELPHVALMILHQHAIQGDVTELQLAAVRWSAFSRSSNLDLKILYDHLSELERMWNSDTLSKEEEDWLAESFNVFLDYSLQLISKHRYLFPPHHRISMNRLQSLLRCLGLLSSTKAFWKCCPFNKQVRGEIISALKKGTLEWYEETYRGVAGHPGDPESKVKSLAKLVTAMLVDLQRGLHHYNSLFESTNGVPYFSSTYKQLEKLMAKDFTKVMEGYIKMLTDLGQEIKAACDQLVQMDVNSEPPKLPLDAQVSTPIFELYLAVQEFASMRENLPDHKSMPVQNFYQWFEPAVDKWLDLAKVMAMQRIHKAMELNKVCSGELIVKHTTSAIDTSACFYQMKEFWRHLAWPDLVGSYGLVMKLLDNICRGAHYYAQLVQKKLHDSGYYEDSGPFRTSDEVCTAVNDLEYVRRGLTVLPDELQIEEILDAVEQTGDTTNRWRDAMYALLDTTINQLEADVLLIITRIGMKMRPSLKKAIFHLAWSPDSLPTYDAITPLLEYLDNHLLSLNSMLLPRNFERVLNNVWEVSLSELDHQMDGNVGDKMAGFYERLYEALDILVDFFHAESKGLPMEILTGEMYKAVKLRLQYNKTDTETLILLYYQDRLREQLMTESTEYGVLSVRAYYHHDSLCVEVLNARDVIPLDPNGFSDPFVIVELLPRSLFPYCSEQLTNVQKKTLNPLFDECFEFSVTLEQCRTDGAMLAFTVMDHDVLTANDFAGEAFLSLGSIPGVTSAGSSDNFHGLKHVELCLMHQKNKNHPVLQALEVRTWDKVAQEFVKKQKPRIAGSS
ncbi:BAI1-associated protein 3 isoform X1 [Bemisia tabaci]|uniref:BAI1-associated protein 3 isoform X1 n=1 Tax=Bemisia tabaci TaxID=7038 RepID=UPI003B27B799